MAAKPEDIRNIAVIGHKGSGKTSLVEAMLYVAKVAPRRGKPGDRSCGLDDSAAEQTIEYILQGRVVLGAVPTQHTVIAERFFDEGGGMQLVIHAPFGVRINKAWGLALLRFQNGKKVPPQIQRIRSDDLLASVFPDVAACQENIEGDIKIPDHPLVHEVMKDVLTEASKSSDRIL